MKLILRLLLLLFSTVGGLLAANNPAEAVQRFKESLKTVDRLVLKRTDFDLQIEKRKGREVEKFVIEIKGTDLIATLGDTLEIKKFDMHCLCLESPEIHFYQGENYRFSLTLHHSNRLRGEDGALGGDAELTEQSAVRFRAWFAQRGYDGFVKRYEEMLEAIAAEKARKNKFLELFPEAVRSLFPAEEERYGPNATKQKIAQFSAQYANHSALVLDCWRGLGESPKSYGRDWEREWQDFLRAILNSREVNILRTALEIMPDDEDRVWVGAYRYYHHSGSREEKRMVTVVSEEWLALLAKRVLPLVDEYAQGWVIKSLAERPAAATNRLLLEIAGSDPLTVTLADENSALPSLPKLSNAMHAILAAAKNRVAGCRTIILRRLGEATDVDLRLALEVALAQFDGPGVIKPAHLQIKVEEVAEMAWQTVTKDSSAQVSIEILAVLAAKSKSYRVRDAAAEKLGLFGLCVMTDEGKAAAILKEQRFEQAQTAVEIEALLADYRKTFANRNADGIEKRVLAALNHRKGQLFLQAGDFEQAAPLLRGGYADRTLYVDEAFALQTLGRFNDADRSLSYSVEHNAEKEIARRLVRRGYLAFAKGEFEDAVEKLTTAKTLRVSLLDDGPLTLIQYLCGLLSGKPTDVPSSRYLSISDSGEVETTEPDLNEVYWPESGSLYLLGKLTEAEVFARIEKHNYQKEKHLCEAHFVFSALCRAKGDADGEKNHLQAALETKAFTNQCYSLATVRFRELSAKSKGDPLPASGSR